MVSVESAAAAVDPVFDGFNWNSMDVGNGVVDWSGFLDIPSVDFGGDVTIGGLSKS